jgi:4-hydroxy-4-methyl-2-oxoglutarate aldolase
MPTTIDPKLVARWRNIPTAVIADMSKGAALIDPAIRPLKPAGQQPRLFGFAVTAHCTPPDFGAVLHALDLVQPNDVLVITTNANTSHAMIGGILGGYLHRKGAAGIVCDGAIRDVAELAAMENFSVYTRTITPLGPTGVSGGGVNIDVTIGNATIHPGDLIIGDDDGLVRLSPSLAASLIDAAETKLAKEDEWIASLKSGKSIAQVFNLQTDLP